MVGEITENRNNTGELEAKKMKIKKSYVFPNTHTHKIGSPSCLAMQYLGDKL
jgi:hypothetical protein